MNTGNLPSGLTSLPILGVFASIGLFYQHIKTFLIKTFRFFIKKRIIDIDLAETFYFELKNKSYIFKLDEYDLRWNALFYKKENCFVPSFFKCYKTEIFLYKYFIPVFLKGEGDKGFSVSYLKFSFPFEKYIEKVIKLYQQKVIYLDSKNEEEILNYERFRIETISGSSLKNSYPNSKNLGESVEGQSLNKSNDAPSIDNNLIYGIFKVQECLNRKMADRFFGVDNEIEQYSLCSDISKEKNKYQFTQQGKYVLNQVEKWLKSKKWYEERNIFWRRGICLYGKTGTGKSSLVLEIAKYFGIPIFTFNLANIDDNEFSKKIDNLESYPGIILFEDLDSIFNKRKNLTKTANFNGLSFDHFINKLSGINPIQNKFIFISTNHLSNLDEALIRPGRIDEIIEIVSLNEKEKLEMAKVFLNGNKELVNKCLLDGKDDSTAQYENRLTQEALKLLWN